MGDESKVSGKVGLDPSEFKNGIAQMNRDLRVLESGFRASAASMGDWKDSATGLELRIKTLNSQMDVQQKKVAATRAEYERIKTEKGETSRAAQDLEIKLNKETETLGKMEAELKQDTEALDQMKQGETETGNAAQEMGNDVAASAEQVDGMQTILAALGGVVGAAVAGLAALGAAAIGAVKGISDLVLSAADAAGQIQDLSDKTGIGTEKLQELKFIGDQTGTSLDTITGAQARLIRSMDSANTAIDQNNQKLADAKAAGKNLSDVQDQLDQSTKPILDAFKSLGVSVRDSNGHLRDSQTVFNEAIDALGRIQNPTERDAIAMQLFGKSAQELNPLIKLGSAGMAEMADKAHKVGAVMSADAVAGLDNFGDSLAGIQDGIKGTLGTLATAFLPLAQKLVDVFQSQILPVFQRFVALAGERLQPVIQAIVGLIDQFASGDIRGGLAQLFGVENADAILNLANIVKDFLLNTLIPFFEGHTGDIQTTFQSIVSGIISVATFITQLAIAWTKTWFTIHDILAPIWEGFLLPIFTQLLQWFTANLPTALQTLSGFWTNVLLPAVQTVGNFLSTTVFPLLQSIAQFLVEVFIVNLNGLANIWQNVLLPAIQVVWKFLQGSLFPLVQAIANFIGAVFNLNLKILAGIWQNILLPAIKAVYGFFNEKILPIFKEVAAFIAEKLQPVFNTFGNFMKNTIVPAFNSLSSAIKGIVDFLNQMAEKLNNLKLPWWLTPHSPTPFEIGLIGVNEAMAQLNKQMSLSVNGFNRLQFAGANAGGPQQVSNHNTQTDSFQFFSPVIVQGDTMPGSLGQRLKGRRY